MKTCSKCKITKLLSEFHKNTKAPDGVRSECKVCRVVISDKDKLVISARYRKYYELNATKLKEKSRNYRQENKEVINERLKKWRKNNSAKIRDHKHKRRALIKTNGFYYVSSSEIDKLLTNSCFYCGAKSKVELDHVIPISKGGTHSIGNLVAACISCNRSKGAKTIMEWRLIK